MRPFAWSVLMMGMSACQNPYDLEGREPYECRDGADNDDDGYYDCDDNGCWESPDCDGPHDTDTGDTDTGDTEGCYDFLCDLQSVHIVMTHDVDAPDDMCSDFLPACDCVVTFEGDGVLVDADGMRMTYEGTWRVASISGVTPTEQAACNAYAGGVWHDVSEDAYHSIHFAGSGSQLDIWVAHRDVGGYDSIHDAEDAMAAGQYSVWDMHRSWSASSTTTTHTETVPWNLQGLVAMNTYLTATFTFNEP